MSKNPQQSAEIFTIWSNEIESRLDPFFYRPIFKKLVAVVNGTKRKAHLLSDIVQFSFAGDWGEDPDTFEPSPDYQLCYVLRNTNFDNKYNLNFDDVAQRYVKNSKIEKLALQKGDILIEKSGGSPIQPVGRVAFVDDLPFNKPVIFSNFLQKIRIAGDSFFPEYVFTFLQTIYHLGYTEFLQNQTTGIKNLRLDDFFKIKIVELPKNEQKKIAKFAFDARKNAKKMEEKAMKILSSIDDFVLGELGIDMPRGKAERVFQVWSDEIEGRIDALFYKPFLRSLLEQIKKQKHFTLGEAITEMSGGATPKVTGDYYLEEGGVPFLRVQNITEMGINLDDVKFIKPEVHEKMLKRSQLKKDDLVFTIIGRPGTVSVVPENFEGNISQNSVRFHLQNEINKTKIIPDYVAVFLNTKIGKDLSLRWTAGGAQPALNADIVKKLIVPLPSVAKQEKIIAGVKTIYEKAKRLRQEAESIVISAQKEVEQMILA
ncbi:MAG: EcoKI restriction-modification system protein HsdS [candidate division TA06 bacterium ADurb.Bin131]|uniref:EcoKI restriction-modification system protein HsdS n=1 Tax=candidate division TA06 bacterium ADurb.Bin131 TaxID=1852827 RepID=A0A1V6C3Z4_UNCT6|nr:MAG: EcoKI restriction-modification system protein HsdS [candidate division TA06 bacterium ADurb.Bin131]